MNDRNALTKKIDFAVIFTVKNANPNGDPLSGNRPRTNYEGYGEVSDVCIKRKIRNRLLEEGESIFVQSDDYKFDSYKSLKSRQEGILGPLPKKPTQESKDKIKDAACKTWLDVRAFGQLFAYKGEDLSLGIRGPVSIHPAFSRNIMDMSSIQITKSVNAIDSDTKGSETMGMKHRVDFGVYVFYGSINPQLASLTGFSDDDAIKIRQALIHLFENDASSARPEGSMEVVNVYWWEHNCKSGQYSSATVHKSLHVDPKVDNPKDINDFTITVDKLDGLTAQVDNGC